MGQLFDHLASEKMISVWLSLDDDDNSPITFVSYLLHTLQKGGLKPSASEGAEFAFAQDMSPKNALHLLISALEASADPVVIFLDEFETLEKEIIGRVINPLIKLAPSSTHFVIASRENNWMDVSKLRLQGLLLEIGSADLRLKSNEITELFGGEITTSDLREIEALTEGWPAALQMLRFLSRESGVGRAILESFGGVPWEIADYLSHQVLEQLAPAQQLALLRCSLLSRITAADLEGIYPGAPYWRDLLAISALAPFIGPEDASRNSFKLHPLFNNFLKREFSLQDPTGWRQANLNSARWFAAQGKPLPALRHARFCDDPYLAGQIVEDLGGLHMWISQGQSRIHEVSRLLDNSTIRAFPRLQLMQALVSIKDGELSKGRRLYENVQSRTENFTRDRDEGDSVTLRLDAYVVESTLIVNEGHVVSDDYLQAYQSAFEPVAKDDEFYRGHVKTLKCLSCQQRGLFDDAFDYGREALSHYQHIGSTHGQIFLNIHLGTTAFATGEAHAASMFYHHATSLARKNFGTDKTKAAIVAPLLAEIDYERGEIVSARTGVSNIIQKLQNTEAWYEVYASGYLTAVTIAVLEAGLDQGLSLLDEIEFEVEQTGLTGFRRILRAARASLLSRYGYDNRAAEIVRTEGWNTLDFVDWSGTPMAWREREACLAAGLATEPARLGAFASYALMAEFLPELAKRKYARSYVRLGGVVMATAFKCGMTAQVQSIARSVIEKSFETQYWRYLADLGPGFATGLEVWLKTVEVPQALSDHCRRIIEADGFGTRIISKIRLTKREQEILVQLSLGRPDKLISRALDVSENTVKYHLKNVYRKLGAENRTDAVAIARRSSLILGDN